MQLKNLVRGIKMFIESSKARGNHYFYVKKYVPIEKMKNRLTLYSLGKIENAIIELERWQHDINNVPTEILEEGITKDEIKKWRIRLINKLHNLEGGTLVNKSKMII